MPEELMIVMPIYDGVTQLDFTGPHQFFLRLPGAKVSVASLGAAPVASQGLTFSSLEDLGTLEACDVLCVPGGGGATQMIEDARYMAAIGRLAVGARYVTSVCTGSLILGAAGLLQGRRAACHWAYRDMLALFGAIPDPRRVVRDGNVITGGGVTAGIDFALSVIAELAGQAAAEAIQLGLEYAPAPPFGNDSGRPATAPAAVRDAVASRYAAELPPRGAAVERAADQLRQHG